MKNFAIIGVGGYIAPRHLKAIRETGNNLIAATDPHDAVGVLDQYFDDVSFFTEFERFDRHLEKEKRKNPDKKADYVSICSPNHLHDAHIRFALRTGSDAICEKPLVINPWNLDALEEIEAESGKKIYTVLQLRVHKAIQKLKKQIQEHSGQKKHQVVLSYITARGPWYHYSWKGNPEKSGGIATNIGIHFFDLLYWLFSKEIRGEVHYSGKDVTSGFLELENADVSWFLPTDSNTLPENLRKNGIKTFRSITIDGEEIDFSGGFEDLHTEVYRNILAGKGNGISDARESIKMVYNIRHAEITNSPEIVHPFLKMI